jgi:glutamate synthase domain-containing protein 3
MREVINSRGLGYRELNERIRKILSLFSSDSKNGYESIEILIKNVLGQRYIGSGLKGDHKINIEGVPGNDLGAFMDGPVIEVFENGQDGIGNTMNSGKLIIHGDTGDITGYSMRGGEIYIKGNTGFRCGIHMKAYKEKIPVIVIGGSTGDFLGEYMAGGIIIILGLYGKRINQFSDAGTYQAAGNHIGTGMHGGTIYIRGKIEDYKLGSEVIRVEPADADIDILENYIGNYCRYFSGDASNIEVDNFIKLMPFSHRPYKKLYTY